MTRTALDAGAFREETSIEIVNARHAGRPDAIEASGRNSKSLSR